MLPLLSQHDRTSFRIHCYSDVRHPDSLTQSLRAHVDVWRDVAALDDVQLVRQIRADEIDILIDLTMHMEANRLLAFAQSPAPVQATYLAYCSTTGLAAMNYRLTDPHLDPPDRDDSVYSEISIRLPRTYWCYQPPQHAGEVSPPPAQTNGEITFGCLNNYSKVTALTWEMWFAILKAVPNSRLLVQSPEGQHRKGPFELMKSQGLDPNRLTFIDRVPIASYFKLYNRIDIALDPFPYGGGTTTCDALWMGMPVVSLAGKTAVSRGGLSLLTNLGFPNRVASDPGQYVRIAADLAKDIPSLAALRSTLRPRMLASPLMDAPSFARDVEAAFRAMWVQWCQSQSIP
jgi:predicted O-linked N-acetylglucosamine transferase (SPINDLY family)